GRHSDQAWRQRAHPAEREAHDREHRDRAAGAPVLLPGPRRERRNARIRGLRLLSLPTVLCLRPEADFARLDTLPPASLAVTYLKLDDAALPQRLKEARTVVIPAVGPKVPAALFQASAGRLVQVTGAGLDRLDQEGMTRLGIAAANAPGNNAAAEYAVTAATLLLRRFPAADAEIKCGNYGAVR